MDGYSQSSLILPQLKLWPEQATFPLPPQAATHGVTQWCKSVLYHLKAQDATNRGAQGCAEQKINHSIKIWSSPASVQAQCTPNQSSTFRVIAINVIKVKHPIF